MKVKVLSLATALLLVLPVTALAASRHSANFTLRSPALVGQTRLKAGRYRVEWTGNGPTVQTKFLKDGKAIATAPATLQPSSPYRDAVQVRTLANHTKVLQDIYTSHFTLKFGQKS